MGPYLFSLILTLISIDFSSMVRSDELKPEGIAEKTRQQRVERDGKRQDGKRALEKEIAEFTGTKTKVEEDISSAVEKKNLQKELIRKRDKLGEGKYLEILADERPLGSSGYVWRVPIAARFRIGISVEKAVRELGKILFAMDTSSVGTWWHEKLDDSMIGLGVSPSDAAKFALLANRAGEIAAGLAVVAQNVANTLFPKESAKLRTTVEQNGASDMEKGAALGRFEGLLRKYRAAAESLGKLTVFLVARSSITEFPVFVSRGLLDPLEDYSDTMAKVAAFFGDERVAALLKEKDKEPAFRIILRFEAVIALLGMLEASGYKFVSPAERGITELRNADPAYSILVDGIRIFGAWVMKSSSGKALPKVPEGGAIDVFGTEEAYSSYRFDRFLRMLVEDVARRFWPKIEVNYVEVQPEGDGTNEERRVGTKIMLPAPNDSTRLAVSADGVMRSLFPIGIFTKSRLLALLSS